MREIKVGRLLPIVGSDQIVMVTNIEVLDNGDRELMLSNGLYARITAYEWAEMATKKEQPISNSVPVDCQRGLAQSIDAKQAAREELHRRGRIVMGTHFTNRTKE